MRVVKAFVKERHFSERFSIENDRYEDAIMDLVKTFGFFFPLISFLSGISTVILILVGGNAVVRNKMSPGDIIAMISYLEMLVWPLMGAGFTVNTIQRGQASLKRINEILDTKSEIEVAQGARNDTPAGGVSVKGLDYAFPGSEKKALEGISFDVAEGTTLGILGRVGCGKSTLLKALPRLLDPGKGTVFIGGVDAGDYTLAALRKAFGFVPQESFLFSDTVRNNILFGAPDVAPERFADLVRIASLEKDIALLPNGLETVVGEKGLTLSGGQKQRIAIARALALDPPILVLDDALSAVDAETEEKILQSLLKERRGADERDRVASRVDAAPRRRPCSCFRMEGCPSTAGIANCWPSGRVFTPRSRGCRSSRPRSRSGRPRMARPRAARRLPARRRGTKLRARGIEPWLNILRPTI